MLYFFDKNLSRSIRLTIYYLKIIFIMTSNTIFVYNYNFAQQLFINIFLCIILNIICILIKKLFQSNKYIVQLLGVFICICTLGFCYYSILVDISVTKYEESNKWIGSYMYLIGCDIIFTGFVIAFVKFYLFKNEFLKSY